MLLALSACSSVWRRKAVGILVRVPCSVVGCCQKPPVNRGSLSETTASGGPCNLKYESKNIAVKCSAVRLFSRVATHKGCHTLDRAGARKRGWRIGDCMIEIRWTGEWSGGGFGGDRADWEIYRFAKSRGNGRIVPMVVPSNELVVSRKLVRERFMPGSGRMAPISRMRKGPMMQRTRMTISR